MRTKRWIGCVLGIYSALVVGLAGCTRDEAKNDGEKPVARIEAKKDNQGKPIAGQTVSRAKDPRILPFQDAVILGNDVPEGELQPPDKTHTGKNAVKIFETIAHDLWDKVTFTDHAGRPIRYQALLATELGDIAIDLFGDDAPNHVRSFVCLAKCGYYDGMAFYYSANRKVEEFTVAYIETGCPRGTREFGSGSIGYWLRREISDQRIHEEGVVGACLGESPESAACRFYIAAAAMPQMDGAFTIFGKVTRGLDVVRTINRREVREGDMLKQPVIIKRITITEAPR